MAAMKRAFISFDVDNDEGAKIMLAGQAKLPDSPFDFKDNSVRYHLTGDWGEKVRRRLDNVDVVIVLCGTRTHTAAGVAAELSMAKDKKKPYFLLTAYSDKTCTKPTSASASDKVYKWTWDLTPPRDPKYLLPQPATTKLHSVVRSKAASFNNLFPTSAHAPRVPAGPTPSSETNLFVN